MTKNLLQFFQFKCNFNSEIHENPASQLLYYYNYCIYYLTWFCIYNFLQFGYHTGDGGSFREESRLPDGTVQGAYGFIDANGKQRIVKYTAGKDGFKAEGDDVPSPAVPVGPSSAPQQYAPQQYAPQSNSIGPFNLEDGQAFKSFMQG